MLMKQIYPIAKLQSLRSTNITQLGADKFYDQLLCLFDPNIFFSSLKNVKIEDAEQFPIPGFKILNTEEEL
ncbi:hypothetical protein BpHYR1_020976 [Brachionus plicatilis]|uniref:Uncharacterized protein n=1 Tax=Brachionus plicatilis TaxID=10195 RepID=A0A3M7QQR7_BRAPC|nr:hypothetical protein BpHYR1_020976 [Brachionus plicatilis]